MHLSIGSKWDPTVVIMVRIETGDNGLRTESGGNPPSWQKEIDPLDAEDDNVYQH